MLLLQVLGEGMGHSTSFSPCEYSIHPKNALYAGCERRTMSSKQWHRDMFFIGHAERYVRSGRSTPIASIQ